MTIHENHKIEVRFNKILFDSNELIGNPVNMCILKEYWDKIKSQKVIISFDILKQSFLLYMGLNSQNYEYPIEYSYQKKLKEEF